MTLRKFFQTYVGVAILLASIIYAMVRVAYNEATYKAPDVTTIRICHWQLEAGFRDALQELIDEYEQLHLKRTGKKIRVMQLPVSERGYSQFVNTGLIGGTAPDIIEKGFAKGATDPAYTARFFSPLGQYLDEPNPYNAGTPLEGVPWKDTFFDGLQAAYDRQLLDHYYVPFSMFTVRIYYNRDLYRQILGTDRTPASYQEFLDVCQRIREHGQSKGLPIVPVAGSKYQGDLFRRRYETPFLFELISQTDDDFTGSVDAMESYLAYRQGRWSFESPRFMAAWKCMLEVSKNFQDGWLAAQRDDAVFLFVQSRAVMTASGSWDAPSIKKQVAGQFEVGVFDFPMPTDHPEYSKFVAGPATEASIKGGIPWAICRQSRRQELCVDFLRFCTTRAKNESFNQSITWLPVVLGAKLTPDLEPFRPRIEGFVGDFQTDISTPVKMITEGNRWSVLSDRMTPEQYAVKAKEVYERTGAEGFQEKLVKDGRNNRNLERILASQLLLQHIGAPDPNGRRDEKIGQLLLAIQEFGHKVAVRQAQFEALQKETERKP